MVCSRLKPHGVTVEPLDLRATPFSLKDKANERLYYLSSGSIETWVDMKQQFLQRFFPASRATHLWKEIYEIRETCLRAYWRSYCHDIDRGWIPSCLSYSHHVHVTAMVPQVRGLISYYQSRESQSYRPRLRKLPYDDSRESIQSVDYFAN
ncbi:UNVERIFIED_CONTAM: hypothetical protein Scaly_2617100 [Sesamum calycinum]|uniref:Retrotransposon gag domain-containing protein n=1 Tax=Sesamum calycinum TaxID=2727403 RepID=A0AAW2JCC3_9LAMI